MSQDEALELVMTGMTLAEEDLEQESKKSGRRQRIIGLGDLPSEESIRMRAQRDF